MAVLFGLAAANGQAKPIVFVGASTEKPSSKLSRLRVNIVSWASPETRAHSPTPAPFEAKERASAPFDYKGEARRRRCSASGACASKPLFEGHALYASKSLLDGVLSLLHPLPSKKGYISVQLKGIPQAIVELSVISDVMPDVALLPPSSALTKWQIDSLNTCNTTLFLLISHDFS